MFILTFSAQILYHRVPFIMLMVFLASEIVNLFPRSIKISLKIVITFNFVIYLRVRVTLHWPQLAYLSVFRPALRRTSLSICGAQNLESAIRIVFRCISKAVQQALQLLSGNVQSNSSHLAASNNIIQPVLLPVSIVTIRLMTILSDGYCFIHSLRYSLAKYLKCE